MMNRFKASTVSPMVGGRQTLPLHNNNPLVLTVNSYLQRPAAFHKHELMTKHTREYPSRASTQVISPARRGGTSPDGGFERDRFAIPARARLPSEDDPLGHTTPQHVLRFPS